MIGMALDPKWVGLARSVLAREGVEVALHVVGRSRRGGDRETQGQTAEADDRGRLGGVVQRIDCRDLAERSLHFAR